MPINNQILSGARTSHQSHAFLLNIGEQVTLSCDVTTTEPNRRTYEKGAVGRIQRFYKNGVILRMADDRKISVSFDFLHIPKPPTHIEIARMPLPYESPL
jgi:hypothetical protein